MSVRPVIKFGYALPMLMLLGLPILALILGSTVEGIWSGVHHPIFFPALFRSLIAATISLGVIVLLGTPLAWWFSQSNSRFSTLLHLLVELPVLLPPAVMGIALLETFGRSGLLSFLGLQIPFTLTAVVLAQTVVAAPYYIQLATQSFRTLNPDQLLLARSLGYGPRQVFWRVIVPVTLPALMSGMVLSWARAMGEFGATLLFAGNLTGRTQTLPLAIFSVLETDVNAAISLSLVLLSVSLSVLFLLRHFGRKGSSIYD